MGKTEWWSCDGFALSRRLTRRSLLCGSAMSLIGLGLKGTGLAQVAVRTRTEAAEGNTLVVIFLRGGVDGLSVVTPYREDNYHRKRPTLGLAAPHSRSRAREDRVIDLDGFFGLHPSLGPLMPLYDAGRLAFVHAVGSMDDTHSHFEAMSAMERGQPTSKLGDPTGWLARHLMSAPGAGSPVRAISIGGTMPDSLRGATSALAVDSLDDFKLEGDEDFHHALDQLYAGANDVLTTAGRQTLRAIDALEQTPAVQPGTYPDEELAQGLRQVAQLIKAGVGLEVACLQKTGWDTHVAQGAGTGILGSQLSDLGQALAAFAADLGPIMDRVTVVAQTEFGRRLQENDGFGTDHGHASVMLLMDTGVKPGVHAVWPGLEEKDLTGPGDLQVTIDYRTVLAEVLSKRLGNANSGQVFPGLPGSSLGLLT